MLSCGPQLSMEEQLVQAIQNGNKDTVGKLIEQGVDLNKSVTEYGESPLLVAIVASDNDMVSFLIDKGARTIPPPPNEHWSDACITTALALNKMDIAENLITHGIGIDARNRFGSTLLIMASCKGYTKIVKLLLESGRIDINQQCSHSGVTALQRAKANEHEEIIKLLLEAGAIE
jgi:ankyrin repeat protein